MAAVAESKGGGGGGGGEGGGDELTRVRASEPELTVHQIRGTSRYRTLLPILVVSFELGREEPLLADDPEHEESG